MTTTTFKKNLETYQWTWHTQADNGQITATGGESYVNLNGAVNGYLSAQGHPEWEPGTAYQTHLPAGYKMEKVNSNEYITRKAGDLNARTNHSP